jgi:hypothetical protein
VKESEERRGKQEKKKKRKVADMFFFSFFFLPLGGGLVICKRFPSTFSNYLNGPYITIIEILSKI